MKVTIEKKDLKNSEAEAQVAFLFDEQVPEDFLRLSPSITTATKRGVEVGKLFQVNKFPITNSSDLIIAGLGKKEDITPTSFKQAVMAAVRSLLPLKIKTASLLMPATMEGLDTVGIAAAGTIEAVYSANLHHSEIQPVMLQSAVLSMSGEVTKEDKDALNYGVVIGDATNIIRSLINHPSNIVTPLYFVNEAKKLAKKHGLLIKVLNEKEINRLGMGAFAAVARGSEEEAYLVHLTYKPRRKSPKTLALVGKGITFDSGGISIKPAEAMDWMKMDMAGGAAVLGAMIAIAQTKPDINVIGLIPLSENLPSGKAIKPGDVVKSLSGKTIEIGNTDAEGRLVLADALTYAQKQGVTHIVDIATLTGSIVVTLGDFMAGIWSKPDAFGKLIIDAGNASGERYFAMPMLAEYGEMMKSYIADLSNIGSGGRKAGAITAAKFLENFVNKDAKWAHLDIAGTAWLEGDTPAMSKGATGFGVATFVNLAHNLVREEQR